MCLRDGYDVECIPELELGVGWEEALVIGWAAEGLFATSLGPLSVFLIGCKVEGITYWVKCGSVSGSHNVGRFAL